MSIKTKVISTILVIIFIFIIFMKISDKKRLSEILLNHIGEQNIQYISILDDENVGFINFRETYIYKIHDVEKISCKSLNLLNSDEVMRFSFENFSKQYLDKNKSYCISSVRDKYKRDISILIQGDKLVLRIYTD